MPPTAPATVVTPSTTAAAAAASYQTTTAFLNGFPTTSANQLTTNTFLPTSELNSRFAHHPYHNPNLSPRDTTVTTVPLVIIPLLCVAIFAMIVLCTVRQQRLVQTSRDSAREGGGGLSTREWVRDVTGKTVRGGKSGLGGVRPGGGRGRGSAAGSEEGGSVVMDENMEGTRRLSTIDEEGGREGGRSNGRWNGVGAGNGTADTETETAATQSEVASEETPRRSSRRDRVRRAGGRSPRKARLRGGRRASSTIREV